MAIATTSEFTRLEQGRITDCKYFLITGIIIDKHHFRATMTPRNDAGVFETEFWVCDIPMAIDNPLLLRACHDSALQYLKDMNPDATFEVVDFNP